jgi:hypothetical protein
MIVDGYLSLRNPTAPEEMCVHRERLRKQIERQAGRYRRWPEDAVI